MFYMHYIRFIISLMRVKDGIFEIITFSSNLNIHSILTMYNRNVHKKLIFYEPPVYQEMVSH